MKKDIHLEMHPVIFRDTGAGVDFVSTSTATSKEKETIDGVEHFVILLDVSSASHPFYTGKENIVDIAGRVEKFKARAGKKSNTGKKPSSQKESGGDEKNKEAAETVKVEKTVDTQETEKTPEVKETPEVEETAEVKDNTTEEN